MLMQRNRKGSGADLLLEIILSTIVFFIVVVFLFGIQAQKQVINAEAHVLSADSALACEMSLVNLLRSNSPVAGLSYEEWFMNSYMSQDAVNLANWKSNVSLIFDNKVFAPGDWELNVTLSDGTVLHKIGEIKDIDKKQPFGCTYYMQFPQVYSSYYCFTDIPAKKITGTTGTAEFNTPEGAKVSCKVDVTPDLKVTKSKDCALDLTPSELEEEIDNYIANTEELDSITLPLIVNSMHYEITVEETVEKSEASVKLEKRSSIEDCSLHINLMTTNITI
jgi:hypothetical protein